MDYAVVAAKVLKNIGGKENVISAAHCATRLRLVIADNKKCSKTEIENIDGVKGVFEAAGQLQIIFGTGIVNKVYEEFIGAAGISGSSKEQVKQAAAAKQNVFKRMIKTLGDVFVPIIPAIVASGLLMGLLGGLSSLFPSISESGTYAVLNLFSNAAFVFLPILIAVSAAKAFGANQYLGAVIGMIMIHPALVNAWAVAGMPASDIPSVPVWFGLYEINLTGYQGHVIPVVIAVWIMSVIEKKLHKIVPDMIDLFVTPLVTVMATGYLTLTMIGPVFSMLENYVLSGAKILIALPLGIGGAIAGAFYAPTVVAGVHHMYNALEAGLLSTDGVNTWMPIATAANVAQGAAALAVAFKTKSRKTKSMAFPASLSAFLGITEPAIFGVNIRYGTPFIAGCIGGALGGLAAGIAGIGATAYGITGLFGFLITTNYTLQYAILILVSSAAAFSISWILYREKEKSFSAAENYVAEEGLKESVENGTIYSPIEGNAIRLSEVKDETFAGEVLGGGFAIVPTTGKVVAPCNGTVETLFETKHAIGIKTEDGAEVLIHIGINTVELKGKFYKAYISEGEKVSAGQLLMEFDIEGIKAAGYDVTTPVIITNSDDYAEISQVRTGSIRQMEKALTYA